MFSKIWQIFKNSKVNLFY